MKCFSKRNLGIKIIDSIFFKNKTLLSKEDSNEESSDPDEEEERLIMAEVRNILKLESSKKESSYDSNDEVDLEEQILQS